MPVGSLKFRKRATSTMKSDERVRAHVRQATELIRTYEDRVPLPPLRFEALPMRTRIDAGGLRDLIQDVREILGVGPDDPIPHLIRAIERSGAIVIGQFRKFKSMTARPIGRVIRRDARSSVAAGESPGTASASATLMNSDIPFSINCRQVSPREAEAEANRFAGSLLFPDAVALEN